MFRIAVWEWVQIHVCSVRCTWGPSRLLIYLYNITRVLNDLILRVLLNRRGFPLNCTHYLLKIEYSLLNFLLCRRSMNFSCRFSFESIPSQISKSGRNRGGIMRSIDSNRDFKGFGIARFQGFFGALDRLESRLESIDRRDRIPTENPEYNAAF